MVFKVFMNQVRWINTFCYNLEIIFKQRSSWFIFHNKLFYSKLFYIFRSSNWVTVYHFLDYVPLVFHHTIQFADRLTKAKNWNTSLNIDIEPISDQLFQTSQDSLLNPPDNSNGFEWCSVSTRLSFFWWTQSLFNAVWSLWGKSTSFYQSFTDFFSSHERGLSS